MTTDDDISDLVAPNSQQLDAVDLLSGPRTFTVKNAKKTRGEQPLSVYFDEFDRPWKPGKNMRRVLLNVWGPKLTPWAGRRITLHCDQGVIYAGKAVGGVRVTHMSGIAKPTGTPIIPTQGRGAIYTVDPLPDLSPIDKLRAEYRTADDARKAEITAEVAQLKAGEQA